MAHFEFSVHVKCDTYEQACIVASERINYDEQYADAAGNEFDYKIFIIEDVKETETP